MKSQLIVSSNSDHIILSGDTASIISNRWANMYMRDNLDYSIRGDSSIVVFVSKSLKETLDDITIIAGYINADVIYDEGINQNIAIYKQEEENFSEFSNYALAIRENNCNVSEFLAFKEALQKYLPARKLYDLQMLSAYHLAFAQNACNFSVPGAGKTSVVYGAYAYLKSLPIYDPKHVDCLLIVGPLSSFGPWELEYKECFGIDPTVKRLIGAVSKTEKENYLYGSSYADITLVSYQSVISIKDGLMGFLKRNKTMIVLDEAHKIKNTTGGIIATSVLEIASLGKSRVVLTGTPAPNGYEDLYNLFRFVWPNKDILKFNVAQLKNMSITKDDSRVTSLLEHIKPFFIRVKKSDLNIPDANFTTIEVKMDESQRVIYDIIEERFINEMIAETDRDFISEITKAKTIRLMQAATNPALLADPLKKYFNEDGDYISESINDSLFINRIMSYRKESIPAKYRVTGELVKDILKKGEKVIIWATFIKNILGLKEYLHSLGIESRELYGATPVAKDIDEESENEMLTREKIIREFNQQASPFNVIIANPFAVAESISLHKACHNAIYLERSFNAAHFIQSKDRIHRYGLSPDVITNYYYLVAEQSIDETVNRRLQEKEQRLLEIIESMPIPLFNNILDNEDINDIKAILNDYAGRTKTV